MKTSLQYFFKIIFIVTALSLSINCLVAQKFGKVDKEIVTQLVHPTDSSADACYLIKKAKAYFDVTPANIFLVIEHHERIKVYNEDGERYGRFTLGLYRNGSEREKISSLKAITFNSKNGKITESKLSNKDVFLEETSEHWSQKKFALPDVRAGSVIDIKYTFRTPYRFFIPRFTFQGDVPIEYAEYEVRIPSYYTYTPVPTGFVPIERSQKDVNGDYNTDRAYTFIARDVPALVEDDYVLDIEDYRSGLKYELYSSQFPNAMQEFYVKDWNEIAKDLMDAKYFGKELNKRTKSLEPFLETLDGKTDDEKIQSVFSYVQQNFSWDGDYGIGRNEGLKNLLKNKSGNVGDINLFLLNLLVQSGIDAKPLLLKARHSGLLNKNFPSRTEFNYLLAYVPVGEQFLLLDATSKYVPIGQLPKRAVNINGLLINGDQGSIIELENPNTFRSVTMAKYDVDLEMPGLIGTGTRVLKNYAATSYRIDQDRKSETEDEGTEEESEDDEDEEEDVVFENDYTINEVQNLDDINKDIKLLYDEQIYNEIAKVGDQIFLDAALDFGMKDNPFYEENREFPVFYSSFMNTRQIITINLPEGYVIESLPENLKMALPNKTAQFLYSVKELGESIVIDYSFKLNTDYFLPNEYPSLKELYNHIVDKSKEKIVLTRKVE